MSERQLAAFAAKHAHQIPFDTSPRHLAGPGDARHVTHALATAGWSVTSDTLSPEIVLRSPDRRLTLQFDPQSPTAAWWRLRAEPTDTEPRWYTEFGELVPAEILGRLTDALITPPPTKPPAPFQILEAAGWTRDTVTTALSPDGMCHVEQRPDQDRVPGYWHIDTCEPGHGTPRGPRIWHAWLPDPLPAHLTSAFLAGLASTSPLQRGMYDHIASHGVVQKPSPFTPEQVIAAHTGRLAALRAQVRAARRPAPNPAPAQAAPGTARPATRR
ncbi:DUF317 domain-containing protein [Streptomyces sp. NPDC057654]|uniref:DUF317 domain-containing protein n=1 Tax=Streptomyces sp. NPDC057654 TaxID=3346196 RepID=UPI00367C6816